MKKLKIFIFLACCVSVEGWANNIIINPDGDADVVVNGGLNISSSDDTNVVQDGTSLTVNGGPLDVAGDIYVGNGFTVNEFGQLWLDPLGDAFSLNVSNNNITSGGDLSIANGTNLNVNANAVSFSGDVRAVGSLSVVANGDFSANNITADSALSITAANITADGLIDLNDAGQNYVFNFNGGTLTANSIENTGVLNVTGGTLNITSAFTNESGASADFNLTSGMTVGGEVALNGFADIEVNSGNFSSGNIVANNGLNLTANNIDINGVIDLNTSGQNYNFTFKNGSLSADNILNDGNLTVNGQTVDITGVIQNTVGASSSLVLTGNLTAGGIENSGSNITINTTGTVDVTGTVKNDSATGDIFITASDLTISGGDELNPSFVNKGNLEIVVTGQTLLANGFDISGMANNNTFSLTTGTLVFQNGGTLDSNLQLFSNNLNQFTLNITGGEIDVNQIINGTDNPNAGMSLSALQITTSAVNNQSGVVNISSLGNVGGLNGIVINGNINTEYGAVSNITASTSLTADEVVNKGQTNINGETVTLAAVVNDGNNAVMNIGGENDETGSLNVTGTVTNTAGNLSFNANELTIGGLITNNSGSLSLVSSDTNLNLYGLDIVDGSVFLNSIAGGIVIQNDLTVNNGALNLGTSVQNITVSGQNGVYIDGNLTASADSAVSDGNVNVAGNTVITSSNAAIDIVGGLSVVGADLGRSISLVSDDVNIGGNVNVAGLGTVKLGQIGTSEKTTVDIAGNVSSSGILHLLADETTSAGFNINGGQLFVYGGDITSTSGDINIAGGVWADKTTHASGVLFNQNADSLILTALDGNVILSGGVSIGNSINLGANSSNNVQISGAIINNGTFNIDAVNSVNLSNGNIDNNSNFDVNTKHFIANGVSIDNSADMAVVATDSINALNVINSGSLTLTSSEIVLADITNNQGTVTVNNSNTLTAGNITNNTNGIITINSGVISGDSLVSNTNTGSVNIYANTVDISGQILSGGNFTQGGIGVNGINILNNNAIVNADSLSITGAFDAMANNATYDIENAINIGQGITLSNGTGATFSSKSFDVIGALNNSGNLQMTITEDMSVGQSLMALADSITNITAGNLSIKEALQNSGNMDLNISGEITVGQDFTSSSSSVINAGSLAISDSLSNSGSLEVELTGAMTVGAGATLSDGTTTNITANSLDITGGLSNSGNLQMEIAEAVIIGQDFTSSSSSVINAGSLAISDSLSNSGSLEVELTGAMTVGAGATLSDGTTTNITANSLDITGGLSNSGNLQMTITEDMSVGKSLMALADSITNITAGNLSITEALQNSGDMDLNISGEINVGQDFTSSSSSVIKAGSLDITGDFANTGDMNLNITGVLKANSFANPSGIARITANNFTASDSFIASGALYQNINNELLTSGDINLISGDFTLTSNELNVSDIIQKSGSLHIYTSSVNIDHNINVQDLEFFANPDTNWLNVSVGGSIYGNTDFIGLQSLTVGGDYLFDNNSRINAAIFDRNNSKYWADVSLVEDNTLGEITNILGDNAEPLISVTGQLIANDTITYVRPPDDPVAFQLPEGQIGITIFDIVDQGSAIWLAHSDEGIVEDIYSKFRNLNVNFCNADGSICMNYLEILNKYNNSGDELPAYISVRDTDKDGIPDSLYVVFDPRFGGPVEVFQIQPIVEKVKNHTEGEYVSAGALDDLVLGQLEKKLFYNDSPIETIPTVFKDTIFQEMSEELYKRMEYYVLKPEGDPLARYSRLFQVRELEQVAGSVVLNEHTSFRSFEDRMFDEFIWNRNRDLNKGWLDIDYGMFRQDVSDDKVAKGDRFNISGGFDWQESETMILGLTARVSRSQSSNSDEMDLSYGNVILNGQVDIDVANTNVGLGAYLMKTFGEKIRVYGNAFLDAHIFDINRTQNFVGQIEGKGSAFSLITEWGLLHDWLNQYIVGNLYIRAGYNTGFSIKEQVAGQDYMALLSDGYLMFTPGYSLVAQKRIYPSAWFQIRPYASIGVEYDVLGAPDFVKYKFAPANDYSNYAIDLNPLWANIGGGVELVSASGIQVGLDYRYQYNSVIQLHNIKLSGSYRF